MPQASEPSPSPVPLCFLQVLMHANLDPARPSLKLVIAHAHSSFSQIWEGARCRLLFGHLASCLQTNGEASPSLPLLPAFPMTRLSIFTLAISALLCAMLGSVAAVRQATREEVMHNAYRKRSLNVLRPRNSPAACASGNVDAQGTCCAIGDPLKTVDGGSSCCTSHSYSPNWCGCRHVLQYAVLL